MARWFIDLAWWWTSWSPPAARGDSVLRVVGRSRAWVGQVSSYGEHDEPPLRARACGAAVSVGVGPVAELGALVAGAVLVLDGEGVADVAGRGVRSAPFVSGAVSSSRGFGRWHTRPVSKSHRRQAPFGEGSPGYRQRRTPLERVMSDRLCAWTAACDCLCFSAAATMLASRG